MMNAPLKKISPMSAKPDQVDMELVENKLRLLERSRLGCPAYRSKVQSALEVATVPADPSWVMGRVLSLLNPYFDKETTLAARKMEAEDWAIALCEFPEWAINRAVRWWKSSENEDRRKRPLEGDIVAAVRREMCGCLSAKYLLESGYSGTSRVEEEIKDRVEPSSESKARVQALTASLVSGSRFPIEKETTE